MRIRFAAIIALLVLLPVAHAVAATGSNICLGASECTKAEVGAIMEGISPACGNLGTCSFTDITQVFYNVGNFVLGIVGALVFLAYVVGGFFFLLSGAPGIDQAKFRQKGMDALKKSTLGLVIVFAAFAGMQTLKTVLVGGDLNGAGNYVLCGPGETNAGLTCGLNMTCTEAGECVTECEQQHPMDYSSSKQITGAFCIDVDTMRTAYPGYQFSGCETGLCPGGDNVQCCSFTYPL